MPPFLRAVAALAVVAAALGATPAPSAVANIHGRIVSIDAAHGTFMIHHDPFALMPMTMTMEVQPKNPAVLRTLHVGEIVNATVDTSIVPWPGTNIRPAPAPSPAAR